MVTVTMASGLALRTISKSAAAPFSVVVNPLVGDSAKPGDCEFPSHPKSGRRNSSRQVIVGKVLPALVFVL